ncbi:MAG TPA: sigma factor [Verrucomicrobiota bacterium]|nr:sigma factor [Verrucomicrobiota bacterium]HNV00420.1 sigma factor [Verrucomicrobiota bacterium]HOG88789.1 sigma factor [Verrucomicrobiota bacterium]HOU89337.1 sigma factor [Verrucomicrobiota bacterium]HPW82585.1 sigma factor [Verrucomicrobiota bacterium]
MQGHRARVGEEREGTFPSSHWSSISLATRPEEMGGDGALNRLLTRYYAPLLAHLEYKFTLSREAAEDVLQDFMARKVLEGRLLGRADRSRGRFRTFLLNVLDNFAKDGHRAQMRSGRRPSGGLVSLDDNLQEAERTVSRRDGDPFDRLWALTVIEEAENDTRRFYEVKKRLDTWDAFYEGWFVPTRDGVERPTDEELARRHGFATARQASNAIVTAKRGFGRMLRRAIARYAESESEVDDELLRLMSVFSRER